MYKPDVMSFSDDDFGSLMPGRNFQDATSYRYGFQGQETDSEIKGQGNSVSFKYRIHDPRLGRFLSIDPLAPDYAHNSPYAFSENSTIAFIELEGLEKYSIHARSFISADRAGTDPLGKDFRGDGRGASLADSGPNLTGSTSRARVILGWDTPDKKAELIVVDADLTVRYASSPLGFAAKKPTVNASALETIDNSNPTHVPGSFGVAYDAKDPLTPKIGTPSLDAVITGRVTEGDGFVQFTGSARGDGFPSTELFVEDANGTRVFLGAHKEQGNILTLYGGASENIFNFDLKIKVDDDGIFKGVYDGDNLINISDYNNSVQENFNNQ